MGKSSIHIQKASGGAITHNSRENYSKSVVFTDEKNELWNDKKQAYELYRTEINKRIEAYTNRTNQKLQKTAVTQLSAVINLEQHHTLKDLEKIKEELEKVFDTKVYQMAIHRDEGKLKHKETNEYLVSGIDFFYNPNDDKYYTSKRVEDKKHIFENELNIFEYEIEKNYHAHIEMLGLDSKGQAIRQKMNRFVLSQIQDFTAQTLEMERGNLFTNSKSNKRLDTHDFKKSKKEENEVKKIIKNEKNKIVKKANEIIRNHKEDKKKLKEELEKLKEENLKFRQELKEYEAERADYKKQEQLNKQLQEDLKANKIELSEALEQIEELKKDIFHPVYKTVSGEPVKNSNAVDYLIQEIEKLKQQENVYSEIKSFQQKVFFDKYKTNLNIDLKGFYIDSKNDETTFINKSKNIKIIDKGDSVGTEGVASSEKIKMMLDICEAKKWDLKSLNINGSDDFKSEVKRQIEDRLRIKELEEELNALKIKISHLESQNTFLELNTKLEAFSSDTENYKALCDTAIKYFNMRNKNEFGVEKLDLEKLKKFKVAMEKDEALKTKQSNNNSRDVTYQR